MRRELYAGWLAMSLVLGSTAAATSARGEERAQPGPSAESERDRAVRDFQEGRRAHAEGRLEEAELSYLRAWSRMKSYDIATNLGQVQLKLNKPVSAAKHLAFGLRTVGPEVEPERLEVMEALLAEAKAQVGTLRVRAKSARDAEVYVDGERVPQEMVTHEVYLEPGVRVVVIRRAGYEDEVVQVLAAPGVTETLTRELKPKAATGPRLAAGTGDAPVTGHAMTKAPTAGARGQEERSWVPVIALGAASAVGLGLGVGFTVASNRASADLRAQRSALWHAGGDCIDALDERATACRELRRTAVRVDVHANAARLAYVTSSALAIAALTYAIWPGERSARAVSLRAGPGLDAGGASIAVVGSW
ncbi:hypothetical protein [Sorangium sp. So ce1024]|uniref:hypothetical protein n=1 Tax=Sorangium sp. So ce1024 TaxID=3133327 RepID=UPI003EFEC3D7